VIGGAAYGLLPTTRAAFALASAAVAQEAASAAALWRSLPQLLHRYLALLGRQAGTAAATFEPARERVRALRSR
jgi:hypothetical protein